MRILRSAVLAIGLAALSVACGSKDKGGNTTPEPTGDVGDGDTAGEPGADPADPTAGDGEPTGDDDPCNAAADDPCADPD